MSDFNADYGNNDENDSSSNPHHGPEDRRSADWVPEDAIKSLAVEKEVRPDETNEEAARRILRENSGTAVLSVIHLATHASTERTRLDASKYVIDRVLGKIGEDLNTEKGNPLESFLSKVEEMANANSKSNDQ